MSTQSVPLRSVSTWRPLGESRLGRDLLAGALAGQVAGLVMAVVVMAVFTIFLGKGPLDPVQVIGSLAFGDAALHGFHLPSLLAGLAFHQLGPALAWGLVLGAAGHALGRRGVRALLALGLAIGIASQAIDAGIVGVAMRALHGRDFWAENVPLAWSWAAHVVFGLALVSFAPIRARLDARRTG